MTLVAYVGPAMAGRRTALRASMGAGASQHPFIDGGTQYRLQSPTHQSVMAFVSSARSNAWYEPSCPSNDPRVKEEIALLRSADGIVFVWDAQAPRTHANQLELAKLLGDLGGQRKPVVCLANKRDCSNQIKDTDLKAHLADIPVFNGVASNGVGCNEALAALLTLLERSKTS